MRNIKDYTFNKMVFLLVIVCIVLMSQLAYSEVLFQANFDNQPDLDVTQPLDPLSVLEYNESDPSIPLGFFGYYIQGSCFETDPQHSTIVIDDTNKMGSTGKGVTFWKESIWCGDWNSDGQLLISLPEDKDEIYISFYVKFQEGFSWGTGTDNSFKFVRATHYWGGSPIQYFIGGNHHPLGQVTLARYNNGASNDAFYTSYRFENEYYPDEATPSHERYNVTYPTGANYSGTGTNFTEGDWKQWVLRLKKNSAPGVADGIQEVYINGVLESSITDLAFSDEGSTGVGWNYVVIGGNDYNFFSASETEQWYAVDNVVVSTTLQEALDGPQTCELFYTAPTGDGLSGVGNGESRNAYRGMYWTGESITTCSGSVRLSPVGNIDSIDYEVAVWSVDVADNLSLDTKLESVIISGDDIVNGWNDFTFTNPVTMTSGNTVIVISRTDPSTLDGTNYIRVYNGYDESDTESRQWNIHYEPTGIMAGRSPGDEDQPEYFTCDWRLNSYEITSALARPNIPEDVVVTRVSPSSIKIDWEERGVNDVVVDHYNVYQYNLSTASLTLVGTSEITEYTHTGLSEGTYTYVVTAVSEDDVESYHSLDNGDLWDAYVEGNPTVLFETNFDSDTDWSPTQPMLDSIDSGTIGSPTSGPEGFDYWWMDRTYFTAPGNNTLNITATNAISGKSLVYYNESNGGGSLWGSDALLIKVLDAPQEELYVMFDAKFSPTWQWASEDTTQQKFFRISHWDGDLPIVAQQANNRPQCIWDMSSYSGGNINSLSAIRYEVDYFATARGGDELDTLSTRLAWSTGIGDGNSHRFKYHIKANSAVGTADGVWELWIDETLVASYDDLDWNDAGSSTDPRHYFNTVQLGGNNFNRYSAVENEDEQYHVYDNLVISTTDIPWDYEIGGTPTYDNPIVTITTLPQSTFEETITIIGSLTTDSALTGSGVTVNGISATADDGTFDEAYELWTAIGVPLSLGVNSIVATGADSNSTEDTDSINVTRSNPPLLNSIGKGFSSTGCQIH